MASVERRVRNGRIRWYVRYRDPAGKQRTKTFDRKMGPGGADQFLVSIESAKLTGGYVDPARGKATVATIADAWLAGKVNLKPTTRERYEVALRAHVLPHWGSTPLDRIEHSDVQDWIGQLVAGGQSGASVRKTYGVLVGILDRAVRDKRLPVNPAKGVDLPAVREQPRRYLTAEQVTRLANASALTDHPDPRLRGVFAQYRLAVLVLAYCGLRWSELAALKVGRVNLLRRRIQIEEAVTEVNGRLVWGTPKSHASRSVPIPRFIADELMVHMAGRKADELLFPSPLGGVLRNRAARRSWFDQAAETIGMAGMTPHELRHTAASLAVSAGANVKAVQRMLGHASAALTLDRYADLFDSDLDGVAEKLDLVARAAGVG